MPEKDYRTPWRRRTGSSVGRGTGQKRAWTQEEDWLILSGKYSDAELSKKLGRIHTAIQVRRCRIKP